MARLNKEALIRRAMESIAADGWTVTPLTRGGTHPARFTAEREGVHHTVRLYIWNLSHGGRSRSASEFRIQVTGISGFEPEAGGRTLILGWSDDFGVFAGFDIQHRLGKFGASPSIQINAATLHSGAANGAALQDKTGGEWAVALHPGKLGRYVQRFHGEEVSDAGNEGKRQRAPKWRKPMYLDSRNPVAVRTLQRALRRHEGVVEFAETLPTSNSGSVTVNGAKHVSELTFEMGLTPC